MRTQLPHLQPILSSPINWDEIEQQYDEMVKYAAAMQTKTADPEAILRRFSRSEVMHPTYKAWSALGRAVKTIGSEERRGGTECVSTCRSRWGPSHEQKK